MNKKRIYTLGLVGFFLMWGIFGFTAAAPGSDPALQATLPALEPTLVSPEATQLAGIPVTGETEPVWTEILVYYGLIGLAALFLILALLNLANKSTVQHVRHKDPSADQTHKN